MSEDLTQKLPKSDSEKLNIILTTVQTLESRIHRLEEQADERRYDTRPLWEKLEVDTLFCVQNYAPIAWSEFTAR